MKRLTEAIRDRLRWVQPQLFDRTFELRHGDEPVATLSLRSAFGSLATARTADGAWTFKRVGFLQPRATVRTEGQPTDLAVFEPKTWSGGGTLRLADGRAILVTTNLWQSRIEFRLSEGHALFRYRTEGFLREQSDLEILPSLERMPEMPWLLLFGWYLVVMMHQDAANSAVIVA